MKILLFLLIIKVFLCQEFYYGKSTIIKNSVGNNPAVQGQQLLINAKQNRKIISLQIDLNIVAFSNITKDEKILWALVLVKNGELDNSGNVIAQLNLQTLDQVRSIPNFVNQEQSNLYSIKRRVIDAQYLTITKITFWKFQESYNKIYPMPIELEQNDSIYLLWKGEDAYYSNEDRKKLPYSNFAWISGHLSFVDKESMDEFVDKNSGEKIY